MKRIFSTILLLLAVTLSPSTFAYWCDATSPSGWGSAVSAYSVVAACTTALQICASTTPHWQVCVVTASGY